MDAELRATLAALGHVVHDEADCVKRVRRLGVEEVDESDDDDYLRPDVEWVAATLAGEGDAAAQRRRGQRAAPRRALHERRRERRVQAAVGNYEADPEGRFVRDASAECFSVPRPSGDDARTVFFDAIEGKTDDGDAIPRALANATVCLPPLPTPKEAHHYEGCQHVKLFVAEYGAGAASASSANLCEGEQVSQLEVWFVHDFRFAAERPLRSLVLDDDAARLAAAAGDGGRRPLTFGATLVDFLARMTEGLGDEVCVDGDTLGTWRSRLLACDTSTCDGVQLALRALGEGVDWWTRAANRELAFFAWSPEWSRGGATAICDDIAWAAGTSPTRVEAALADQNVARRTGAVADAEGPKCWNPTRRPATLTRDDLSKQNQAKLASGETFGWVYVGSHNFSAAAWGAGPRWGYCRTTNWELGVVLQQPPGRPAPAGVPPFHRRYPLPYVPGAPADPDTLLNKDQFKDRRHTARDADDAALQQGIANSLGVVGGGDAEPAFAPEPDRDDAALRRATAMSLEASAGGDDDLALTAAADAAPSDADDELARALELSRQERPAADADVARAIALLSPGAREAEPIDLT
ncbi:hypothetical protein JL720_12553 [Aureococcus anophagefferens]|nr:hypothetical protein JL720_12553 [Aureococcus anophagefferens]